MRMKVTCLISIVGLTFLLLFGCDKRRATKTGDESPENYVQIRAEDAEMNAAIAEARARIGEFVDALQAENAAYHEFYVKKPYCTPGGEKEHMWIGQVTAKDGNFSGVIANDAVETKEVSVGQTVEIAFSEISDWKFQDGAKLIGGSTIRYFYNRMNGAEKEAFRKESGLTIE